MTLIHSDPKTVEKNQMRRYARALQDAQKHKQSNTRDIVLMLAGILVLVAGGLFVFHLLG